MEHFEFRGVIVFATPAPQLIQAARCGWANTDNSRPPVYRPTFPDRLFSTRTLFDQETYPDRGWTFLDRDISRPGQISTGTDIDRPMGCPRNIVIGQGLKDNTAAHA